jgi:hypothetical protein
LSHSKSCTFKSILFDYILYIEGQTNIHWEKSAHSFLKAAQDVSAQILDYLSLDKKNHIKQNHPIVTCSSQ